MFLCLSRLKILRSSVRKGQIGPRRNSICLLLNSSSPVQILTPLTKLPVVISLIRALFISYGFENKMRSEVKEFINILPCVSEVLHSERVTKFINEEFNDFVSLLQKGFLLENDEFQRHALVYKHFNLQIEEPMAEHSINIKKIPYCIAVNTLQENEALPVAIQAKAIVKLIHTMNYENTRMVVGRNARAEEMMAVLTNKISYNRFLESLRKGEDKSILVELQKIVINYKRYQVHKHSERIKLLFTTFVPSPFTKEKLLCERFPNAVIESVFKTGHSCSYESIKAIEKSVSMYPTKFFSSYCWSALFTHHTLKKLF